jgi:hypothetical protein
VLHRGGLAAWHWWGKITTTKWRNVGVWCVPRFGRFIDDQLAKRNRLTTVGLMISLVGDWRVARMRRNDNNEGKGKGEERQCVVCPVLEDLLMGEIPL